MTNFNRRNLLRLAALGSVAASVPWPARALAPERPPLLAHEPFDFVFLTDTHIQPELNAAEGCRACFRHARGSGADFAILGGDHVMDALAADRASAVKLMDLYKQTEQDLGMKAHHTIGNHDCLGIYTKSGVAPSDPLYGKKYFEDNLGAIYYSFDHKGGHFVVLDTIGITPDRLYEGRIDAAQLEWLAQDLAKLPAGMPVIAAVHIPLVTASESYMPPPDKAPALQRLRVANAWQVLELFNRVNVIGVFQGHSHILEQVVWHGVPYITGGAVCGGWWHGTHMGTPEGYLAVRVAEGKVTTQYVTYGFQSIDPRNT